MNAVFLAGVLGLGAFWYYGRNHSHGGVVTLPGMLAAVWLVELALFGLVSGSFNSSVSSLVVATSPLWVVLLASAGAWYCPASKVEFREPRRAVALLLIGVTVATLIVLAYDVYGLMLSVQENGPALALARVRQVRGEGNYYPGLLMLLNPMRMLAAPLGWCIRLTSNKRWLRNLGLSAVVIGILSSLTTTGRAPFVITLIWMAGSSYCVNQSAWGMRGLLKRIVGLGGGAGVFFVLFGVAIGKTHPATTFGLPGWVSDSPLASAAVTLIIYITGPLAALANSITSALGQEFESVVLYPIYRVLSLLGVPTGNLSYGLPFLRIPFPINTYTFLGPGHWLGGWVGSLVYVLTIVVLLLATERAMRKFRDTTTVLLYGYAVSAVVMSTSSDYFFSMGFTYQVYAIAAGGMLLRSHHE
jgi:hypothetical protein